MRPSYFNAAASSSKPLSKRDMVKLYLGDVRSRSIVSRPPPCRPQPTAQFLRVVQWNLNDLGGADSLSNESPVEAVALLLGFDADVLVIHECGTRSDSVDEDPRHVPIARFATELRTAGYVLYSPDCLFPTVIATRLQVHGTLEVVALDENSKLSCTHRAASCVTLCLQSGSRVLLCATHLHDDNGSIASDGVRYAQAARLLHHFRSRLDDDRESGKVIDEAIPILVVADFNQPRARDYSDEEWQILAAGMAVRGAPQDDGVCALFEELGFTCFFDQNFADRNWPSPLPPPTHWTGTAIDYAFARGILARGVYVATSALSDHLPVVSDWEVVAKPRHDALDFVIVGHESIEANLLSVFQAWDSNADGLIDECELEKVLVNIGIPKADVAFLFVSADINQDGRVDYGDFIRWICGSAPTSIKAEAGLA